MTAASVRDDIARLLADLVDAAMRGVNDPGQFVSRGRTEVKTGDHQDWYWEYESLNVWQRRALTAHLADVLAAHVEPLLADLRADNDKLRDEHQAWRSAVAWQKRGLAAEAKVKCVETLLDGLVTSTRGHCADEGIEYVETDWHVIPDLRAALRGDDAATPRCQHVSPSPWGPTQCALEDGHAERHAYNPSEVPALRGDDAATHTEDK